MASIESNAATLEASQICECVKSARWVKTDPERVSALLAPSLGLSSRALVASLERELNTSPLTEELIAAQQDIADTLLRLRLISRSVTVADAQWAARNTALRGCSTALTE